MAMTKLVFVAVGFSSVAILFTLLAFVSSSWLVTDDGLEPSRTKFENLGLWIICFKNFEDPQHWYDIHFRDCWWAYDEEFYIIHKFLIPGFYIAVQFFFSICFILSLVSSFLMVAYLCTSRNADDFVYLLAILGSALCIAAFFGSIAVIIFGAYGDARYWMPDWEHNNMGWSYWVAVIGTVAAFVGGVSFLVESRKHSIKRKKFRQTSSDYAMERSL